MTLQPKEEIIWEQKQQVLLVNTEAGDFTEGLRFSSVALPLVFWLSTAV